MGKLFSNPNQANTNGMASPGYCHGHGCGHGCHGYNAAGAGEPCSGNRHCMGFCNPPKLYADTYSYLNQNLMQPVVKEVYDDLKSISPANAMGNNPMAAQMGLSQGNNPNLMGAGNTGGNMRNMMPQNQMPGGAMGNQNAMANSNHGPNVRFGNVNMDNTNANTMQMGNPPNQQQMGQPMGHMGGMGPNIVNMMMGDAASRSSKPNQGAAQAGVMGNNAPPSPEMAMNPVSSGQGQYNMPGNNPGQYNTGNMGVNNMGQGNPGAPIQNPTTQYMTQPNTYAGANPNTQGFPMAGNMSQMNPGSQQMRPMSSPQQQMSGRNPYGQHSAGIAKFNEMFPGVMQGDLGFDPMAIAIQMNPANQQKAAMDTMQKMMMSNGEGINRNNALQPVINATNAAAASIAQANQPPTNQVPAQQNMAPTTMQQQLPGQNAGAVPIQNNQVPQQQVYTALTGAPTMNQQQVPQQGITTQQQQYQQQYQGHYQPSTQQVVDPNTGAGGLPTVYEGSGDPNARQDGSSPGQKAPATTPGQQMYMEPIFPADTSRHMPPAHMNMKPEKYYHYNTLGQPVEMLPARIYHSAEPNLPQTLSPQHEQSKFRGDPTRYSNVKATVSKTSLMGSKPVGRTPSRGQLQHIYNQYKGSQSYTQQNIKPPDNGASYSEGHLNVPQGNAVRHAPVERVGGDTAANNAVNTAVAYKADQMPGQVGDVAAANKPLGDTEKVKPIEIKTNINKNLKLSNNFHSYRDQQIILRSEMVYKT